MDSIRALEELKCAAAAAQADLAVALDASMRDKAAAAGVPAERQGRGIGHQVALARRESPHRGQRHLGLAKVLHAEMPHTMAAFRAGRITEWAATLLARETACLELTDRKAVDRALAADADALAAMSERQIAAEAARLAARLDPASVVRRRAKAEAERRVTVRPAPDTMSYLTGLLPVAQGVAVYAALKRAAETAVAIGDERSRGQIMADTLVERVTGQAAAPATPAAVNLVVSDTTLLAGGADPGHLDGYGPIPADLARQLVATSLAADCETWLRTVYAGPHGGPVAMSSRARLVPKAMGDYLTIRDGATCRTPWCDAPIRHFDHASGVANGGQTAEDALQGLCESCNYAKQAPGWAASGTHPPGQRHRVRTTTPTGHSHLSTAPQLPGEPLRHRPRRLLSMTISHTRLPDIELAFGSPAA